MLLTAAIVTALATALATTPEPTPKPGLASVVVESNPGVDTPYDLVAGPGRHYVLRGMTSPINKYPDLWIDVYDDTGARTAKKYYEIERLASGQGFQAIRASATDHLGRLYFAFLHSFLSNTTRIVKLAPDLSTIWTSKDERRCQTDPARLFPMAGAKDLLMTCGSSITRWAETTGAKLYRNHNKINGTSEDGRSWAVKDNFQNIYVVAGWLLGSEHGNGLALNKIDPGGEQLWRKSIDYPTGTYPKPRYAFVTKDHGVIAVVSFYSLGATWIEVHKYDKDGVLQAMHKIEPANRILETSTVIGGHTPSNDIVYIAWDDGDQVFYSQKATEWAVAKVKFEEVPGPSRYLPPGQRRGAPPKLVWRGETLMTQRIRRAGPALVDMVVDAIGRVHLVGVGVVDGGEHIRLIALSRFEGGRPEEVSYRRGTRHARPTHMIASDTRIFVLGRDSKNAGGPVGADADVLHLTFWKDAPEKRKPTFREIKPKRATLPPIDPPTR